MTSSHLRPGSVPWDYDYAPMGSAQQQQQQQQQHNDHNHDYYMDGFRSTPRTVDPSLPPIPSAFRPPHDRYDPGMAIRGNSNGHGHGHGHGNDFSGSISPIATTSHLPGGHLKHRRTSLESGIHPRKPPAATSRLGLDPAAKAERRREQNRLAQRAFRARAKVREQGQVCLVGLMFSFRSR